MYCGVNDLLDWLQDARLVDRREAMPLIEALEDLDDQVRAGNNGTPQLDLSRLRRAAAGHSAEIRKIATLALARFGDDFPERGGMVRPAGAGGGLGRGLANRGRLVGEQRVNLVLCILIAEPGQGERRDLADFRAVPGGGPAEAAEIELVRAVVAGAHLVV